MGNSDILLLVYSKINLNLIQLNEITSHKSTIKGVKHIDPPLGSRQVLY